MLSTSEFFEEEVSLVDKFRTASLILQTDSAREFACHFETFVIFLDCKLITSGHGSVGDKIHDVLFFIAADFIVS